MPLYFGDIVRYLSNYKRVKKLVIIDEWHRSLGNQASPDARHQKASEAKLSCAARCQIRPWLG